MIMSGSNLETCEHFCEEMENVVVGKIEKIEKHPDADKLVVCQINAGEEDPVQIVTGAPNVFEGALRTGGTSQEQDTGTAPRTAEAGRRSEDHER